MPKYLSNWSAKRSGATITIEGTDETGQKVTVERSGATITIEGTDETGQKVTVAGVERIEGKTGKGVLAHQKLKGSTPIKLEA
jgi:hypothetical protein